MGGWIVLASLGVAPPAASGRLAADPAPAVQPAAPATPAASSTMQVSLAQLGYPHGITLSGDQANTLLFLPVVPGAVPEVLTLRLTPAPAMPSGKIWASVNGTVLAGTVIPALRGVFHIPLSTAGIVNGVIPLQVNLAVANPNPCLGRVFDWVALSPQSAVSYTSSPPVPAPTVSDFFPSYLQAVTVRVPARLTPADAQAVLALGSYLAHRYGTQAPPVRVATAWPTRPPGPFERWIWIGGPRTGIVSLADGVPNPPVYALSLGAQHVGSAAQALFQSPLGLGAIPVQGARALTAIPSPQVVGAHLVTLAQLGYPSEEVQGSGNLTVTYRFAQADLGQPVRNVAVRIAGIHSPLVSGAAGYLTMLMNGTAFFSAPLTGTRFDLYAPVPHSLLQRDNTLTLSVAYTPPGGDCSVGALPLTLAVDNASYLAFRPGQTLPPGFDRFPQVFAGGFDVFLAPLTVGRLQLAVTVLQALQATTRRLLRPHVVTAAPSAGSPLLAIDASPLPSAPIRLDPFELVQSNGQVVFRYQPSARFAALEAYHNTLLLVGPDALASRLVEHAMGSAGWYGLSGDVVLQGTSGPPSTLQVQGTGLVVEPLGPRGLAWWQRYRPEVYGAILALVLGFLVWLYPRLVQPPRSRRRRRRDRHVGG